MRLRVARIEFFKLSPNLQHNVGLQLRRAISIHLREQGYLRNMLSRRQLQGFVGQP
jgi:hypothetical protein